MPKPYFLRVQEAIMNSDLHKDARHLLHVMAVSADSRTGVGWLGQVELADRMGCSVRHVRDLLTELTEANAAPVRVERRARFHADGRGRSSDEWKLVLVDAINRHSVPAEPQDQPAQRAARTPRLTGTPRRTNRHATTDQPAQRAAHDLRSDLRSDLRRRERPSKRVPDTWRPTDAHRQLAQQHAKDFDLELERFRDHTFKHAHSDWNAAFRNWLRRDFGRAGGPKRAAVHAKPAELFDASGDDFGEVIA